MLPTDIMRSTPGKFLCEPGAIGAMSLYIRNCAVLVLAGRTAWQVAGDALRASMEEGECTFHLTYVGRECYYELARDLAKTATAMGAAWIVGVGGGKVMDLCKLVAEYAMLPVATIPTNAATCASWTSLSVVYDQEGKSPVVHELPDNPQLLLADTDIIQTAPTRQLLAGSLDALAKWYEISSIVDEAGRQEPPIITALTTAKLCRDLVFDLAPKAYRFSQAGGCDASIPRTIWINLVLPGIASGLLSEQYKFSIAHAFYNSSMRIPGVRTTAYHGEIVAFGIAVQLYLQDANHPELEEFLDLCVELDSPVTLQGLGVSDSDDALMAATVIGVLAQPGIVNLPFAVDEQGLWAAIRAIESKGSTRTNASVS